MGADSGVTEMTRALTTDVFVADGQRQPTLNSIRRYRALCRECYAILLLSQAAGADIEHDEVAETLTVRPDGDRGQAVLAAAMNKGGKALAYPLREWVLREQWPGALSFVWDSLRRDVVSVWTGKDPEFTAARRGWLALQGARGVAQFQRRGIGFPRATARPKLDGHGLTLKWDHRLGPVTLSLPKLDGGRWHVWRSLRDGEPGWKLGTLYLGERDGRLKVTVSYTRPAAAAAVDPGRCCRVSPGEADTLLVVAGPDGAATLDTIGAAEAVAWLAYMESRRIELERRKAACGNPRRPWGHRRGWLATQDVLGRLTGQRARGQRDRNHAWTRRIVTRAVAWRCGRIELAALPEDGLRGRPWQWAQFREFLAYKVRELGIEVVS